MGVGVSAPRGVRGVKETIRPMAMLTTTKMLIKLYILCAPDASPANRYRLPAIPSFVRTTDAEYNYNEKIPPGGEPC